MQKRAVLVCNGNVNTKFLFSHIKKDDFLIAVDGGANKLAKTQLKPEIIIGDMDSITKESKKRFKESKFLEFPKEKDQVDLELALEYCTKNGFKEILILGAIGSRFDMSMTNVFLLSQIPKNVKTKIFHKNQEIYLLPKKSSIDGTPGEKISFFPIKEGVKDLTLKGFKYELQNHHLKFGTGKGLSNQFKNKKTLISFSDGMLLCVHFKNWF